MLKHAFRKKVEIPCYCTGPFNSPLGGHPGVSRTIKRLKLNYNWRHMKRDVKHYIKHCELCQKNKSHVTTKQPMLITSTVVKPFEGFA